MRKGITRWVMALPLLATLAMQAQTSHPLAVRQMTLSNGMTVWLNEDHSQPMAFGAVVVKAGSTDCPNTGIAHYFEHIMFKGTDKIGTSDYEAEKVYLDSIATAYDRLAATRDANGRGAIQRDINRLSQEAARYAIPNEFSLLTSYLGGSGLNANTSYDRTAYFNTFSPQYLSQWAELNSERLLSPVYRLFQGELETVYEEKNMYADNFMYAAMEKGMGEMFAGTPYAYPVIGSTENLKNPRLSEMADFYKKYYVAGNMGLVLSGDITADSIMPLLERTFGRLPAGKAPSQAAWQWPDFDGRTVQVRVPLPLVKVDVLCFKGPDANSDDAPVMSILTQLLSNEQKTGSIDSLVNKNEMMMALAGCASMKRVGAVFVAAVPNIPLGSKKKAEALCMQQVERIKRGDFSAEKLELLKRNALSNLNTDLETINKRAGMMVEALGSSDGSWEDYLRRRRSVASITKDDIVRVANKYFNGKFLRLVKKFGSDPKDQLTQPGYKPVAPTRSNQRSAYAERLMAEAPGMPSFKYIDFDHDVTTTSLGPLATLYTVKNPVNDQFRIDLVYHKGTLADPRLDPASDYMESLGTDSLTLQQVGEAFQRMGVRLELAANKYATTVSLTGPDDQLAPSLRLYSHLVAHAKVDEKKLDDIKKAARMAYKSLDEDGQQMREAVQARIMYGEQSPFLKGLGLKDIMQLSGQTLIDAFREVTKTECSVAYSGSMPAADVARVLESAVDMGKVTERRPDPFVANQPSEAHVIYVYQMPKARQNIVGSYIQVPGVPTLADRMAGEWWGQYFGGDMSSLMFQEIREFRSLAYYAQGAFVPAPYRRHNDAPASVLTVMGTQVDKTLSAIGVLDSLMDDMPMREATAQVVKRAMMSQVNHDYPSFRGLGNYVGNYRVLGYAEDPNKGEMEALGKLSEKDVERFYQEKVKNAPRTTFIVGKVDKKMMQKLSALGTVRTLTLKDVMK